MKKQNDIQKKKNKLYSDLLIAIKEETVEHGESINSKKNNSFETKTESNEMTLYDAIKNIFQNLEKYK